MKYLGGKSRIAKELSSFINKNYLQDNDKTFVDLFCGSCNIITKIDKNRKRIANDKHKYLIAMWKELQNGWIPPENCTREQYYKVKAMLDYKPHVSGFIGFGCSYGGRWIGDSSYAFDNKGTRNYCKEAKNGVMKKLADVKDVAFYNENYDNVPIPENAVVYCDIPYRDTTCYSLKEVGKFSHDEFYEWCKQNKYKFTILISEYEKNVPDGYNILWKKQSKTGVRGDHYKSPLDTTEVLITPILD